MKHEVATRLLGPALGDLLISEFHYGGAIATHMYALQRALAMPSIRGFQLPYTP